MPALNFMKTLSQIVELGIKTQTIRQKRKKSISVGDIVFLYTGMRTAYTRYLGKGEITKVSEIDIYIDKFAIEGKIYKKPEDLQEMALKDGFLNWGEMILFFFKGSMDANGIIFKGELFEWDFIKDFPQYEKLLLRKDWRYAKMTEPLFYNGERVINVKTSDGLFVGQMEDGTPVQGEIKSLMLKTKYFKGWEIGHEKYKTFLESQQRVELNTVKSEIEGEAGIFQLMPNRKRNEEV